MAGKKGQKKRFWSDDEKRSICGQARVSGGVCGAGRPSVWDECEFDPQMA